MVARHDRACRRWGRSARRTTPPAGLRSIRSSWTSRRCWAATTRRRRARRTFQYLALAADIRSDRDEVAPRVLSYRPPLPLTSHQRAVRTPRASRCSPRPQPLNVYNAHVRQRAIRRRRSGGRRRQAGAAEERARLHPRRPGAHAHAGAAPRDEQAGRVRHVDPAARVSIRLSLSAANGRASQPTMPESFAMTGAGATGCRRRRAAASSTASTTTTRATPTNHPHQRWACSNWA